MSSKDDINAILLLEDGTIFKGNAAGKIGTTLGEICFNTAMTGYQEVFTDPSYFKQLVVMTNTHIGNYGTMELEVESDSIKIAGLICKNFNIPHSRSRADLNIQEYFEKYNLIGIQNVDTRQIVRHVRNKGAMNAILSSEILDIEVLRNRLNKMPSMKGLELASFVSTRTSYFVGDPHSSYKIAVIDYGVKQNILRSLSERSCYLKVYPSNVNLVDLLAWKPDGVFISNGPGDPAAMPNATTLIKQILDTNLPVFGICLGHQLLAMAIGIKTYKMHNGHRGINHPVKNLITGTCEITSQNHGFSLNKDSVKEFTDILEITHLNLNDGSIEGIRLKNKPVFSVQFHPEANPGPHDSRYLFDQFLDSFT